MQKKNSLFRLFSVLLLVGVLVFPGTGVMAENNNNEELKQTTQEPNGDPNANSYSEKKLNTLLENKLSYPSDVVAKMTLVTKRDLVESNAKYVKMDTTDYSYNEETGEFEEIDENQIGTFATISRSDMSYSIGVSQLSAHNGNERFRLWSQTQWNKDTYFNLTDRQALSYDSKFQSDPVTNGGYTCAHYISSTGSGSFTKNDSCGGYPGDITYGGAAWNINVLSQRYDMTYTALNVMRSADKNGVTEYGTSISRYAHDTSPYGSIGVTIGWASITYGGGGARDEASNQTTWSYVNW